MPLTACQRDIWVAHELFPGSPQFTIYLSQRYTGVFDQERLLAALRGAARANDAFRLRFAERDGTPVQWVDAEPPAVEVLDFSRATDPRAACEAWTAAEASRPFDVRTGPPVRLALLKESATAAHVYTGAHHLVTDAWGLHLFSDQVRRAYAGRDAVGPPSFTACAADERDYRASPEHAEDRAHFARLLDGVEPALFPRRVPAGARQGGHHSFALPDDFGDRVRDRGWTPFAFIAAAFGVYLSRIHGADTVTLGVPLFNRRGKDERRAVGQFANTLPLPLRVAGDMTLRDLVGAVQRDARELQRHERFAFGDLLADRPAHARQPFDVTLSYVQWPAGRPLPGVRVESSGITRVHDQDALAVVVNEHGGTGSTVVDLDYATDVFDRDFPAEALARHLRTLLLGVLEDDGRAVAAVPLLQDDEHAAVVRTVNATERTFPDDTTLHALFAAQAARTPDRTALTGAATGTPAGTEAGTGARTELSYAALDARAERLATALRGDGVAPGDRVAVVLDRSAHTLVAVLAVLKAGAAYVPVDTGHPADRIAHVLEDSGVRAVLTGPGTPPLKVPDGVPVRRADGEPTADEPAPGEPFPGEPAEAAPPAAPGGPGDLAYVIYTSGSTGTPKGVMVDHRAVVNRLTWMQRRYPLGADDVILHKTPVSFDVSVWELFWWGIAGARVALLPPGAEKDPREVLRAIEAEGITVVHFVPSMFRAFLDLLDGDPRARSRAASLRRVFCSGEALPPDQVADFHRLLGHGPALTNLYGPTEATVDVSYHDCVYGAPSGRVPIGRPIDNLRLYVLDRFGDPQPAGAAGELCIAGVGLARGYLGRPVLTAERFTRDPFTPGGRMYRSGDLARRLADGSLEYLGRIDRQVKVRGNRVEPGEIEHQLTRLPAVRDAVVTDRPAPGGGIRLVAHYTAEEPLDDTALRSHLAATLPEYMVPSRFVRIDRIPLTPNGKADRAALPDPGPEDRGPDHAAPGTPAERALAEAWAEALGVRHVGVHDEWFALGGDSLLLLRARAAAERRGAVLALADMVRHTTVATQAPHATLAPAEQPPKPFALVSGADRARLGGLADAHPVTRLQLGMLHHSREQEDSALYHDVLHYAFAVAWNEHAFRTAFDRLVRRHAALRSAFDLTGCSEPLQTVWPRATGGLRIVHVADDDTEARAAIDACVTERRTHRYDLARPPLYEFRAHVRKGRLDLVLGFHHAILDGWSVAVLVRELMQDYLHGLGADIDPVDDTPRPSFAAYVRAERRSLGSAEDRAYWCRLLAGAEPVRPDPYNPHEPPREPRLTVRHAELPDALSRALDEVARRHAVPLRLLLFTAHCLTLRLLAGATDVTTGLVTHGRPGMAGADAMAGLFLNTVPFRLTKTDGSWLDAVRDVVGQEKESFPHTAYPLSAIRGDLGGGPVTETAFNHIHPHTLQAVTGRPELTLLDLTAYEETSLALLVNAIVDPRDGRTLRLRFDCDGRSFSPAQADQLVSVFHRILARIAAHPDETVDFSFLTEPATAPEPLPDPPGVLTLIDEQIRHRPDEPAVVFGAITWTYAELDRAADRVAGELARLAVPAGAPVGIAMDRSPEMVAVVLGVLRAGAACLPLDVSYPAQRLARMVERARPHRVVAHARHAGLAVDPALLLTVESLAPDDEPAPRSRPAVGLDDLGLVLFTSGSSGEPKGVELPHRLWANYVRWQLTAPTAAAGERTLQFAPLSFDVSFQEIFSTLAGGGALVLVTEEDRRDPAALLRLLDEQRVRRAFFPYVALQQLADASGTLGPRPRNLSVLISSGEQLRVTEEIRRFCAALSGTVLENQYGPTETNVVSTHAMTGDPAGFPALPPIGRPIDGAALHVVDERLRPVPPGVLGEIVLGGACLARGYRDRPDLTAERFVTAPWGERLYRTGDLGRVLPGGDVVWRGRADDQVKVRGFRVEPAEVELALMALDQPGVEEAAVVARRRDGGDSYLAAFLVGSPDTVDLAELRGRLRATLPEHMVPSHLSWLPALPLTPSGKRDDAALRARPLEAAPARARTGPRDARERAVADILGDLLGVPDVGVDEDFFALGGTSLTAMRLMVAVEKRFGVRVPLAAFATAPTVAALAGRLGSQDAVAAFDAVVPIRTGGTRRPLFLVHPLGGNVLCYVRLARHLPDDQPVYALQAAGAEPGTVPSTTMDGLARGYLEAVRRVQPDGPYRLGGWSFGGFVAFEMARQLHASDPDLVEQVVILDSIAPDPGSGTGDRRGVGDRPAAADRAEVADRAMLEWFFWELIWADRGGDAPIEPLPHTLDSDAHRLDFIADRAAAQGILTAHTARAAVRRLFRVYRANWAALRDYRPHRSPIDITLVKATAPLPDALKPMHGAGRTLHQDPLNGWSTLTSGRVHLVTVPADHLRLLDEPHVRTVGRAVSEGRQEK
ncbi:non-ribosomal peptide synthetase [Streptomyces sulfonofaciens]|uniref:Non-ribosomal peptide synthetase n=1 Tax=Streptomyces sulfonofaciens TaxID=68272 RepID=A0A919GSF4_9ACTN|nr:non-ribosomal peptide synthetase [Streptomyces sulfonofaciens]GHH88800.1 non-ribosomal peptide synthetase [Streptomyces sulfonofaciens]